MGHGACSCVCLRLHFYNVIFKIKHKLYIRPQQQPPPRPAPLSEKFSSRTCVGYTLTIPCAFMMCTGTAVL